MYEQKEIVLVPFPFSDLTGSKQRPALVISNKRLNKTEDRIYCLITSKPSQELIPITNDDFKEGNLPFKSYIKPYRIFAVNQKVIKRKLCTINKNFYNLVLSTINRYLEAD